MGKIVEKKSTSLRHITVDGNGNRVLNKVYAKNHKGYAYYEKAYDYLFYLKDNKEVIVNRNQCSNVTDINKETTKLNKQYDNDVVYGINDFGYPNSYWE